MNLTSIIVTLIVLIVVVGVASVFADTNRFRGNPKTKDTFRSSQDIGKTNIGSQKKAMNLSEIARDRNLAEGKKLEPKMPKSRATRASTRTAIEVMTKKASEKRDS